VEARGELRGETQFDTKPLLSAPTIMHRHEVITQGHIKEGAKRKGASANYDIL
jgi:hypothetical protein